ncbi:MAG: 50S ribosomal protein L15 [Treponema sp.]|jgi:large subunit ribosomal protein L15|nr:50S ribosomal protein L15 [Treponema sp.]
MHDFDLHAPAGANKRKRIIGRGQGSGRGTTAGKGTKGQKARSGGKTYVGFEGGQMPLYRRLAQRGFSNYPFKKEFQVVNLGEIEKRYADGETVDVATLTRKRLIKGTAPVKILGNGDFTRKLTVVIGALSASAKEKIEKAGGTVAAPGSGVPDAGSGADAAGVNATDAH